MVDQGIDQDRLAAELLDRLLEEHGLRRDELGGVVATGYGRKLVGATRTAVTEITCQAWGVRHGVPEARTIIDIGGQDSKLVRLSADGTVADFVMNDRCAAGSGRFLEMLAAQLGTKFSELESLVRRSRKPATISSMCVVFAETEIVGLLASGVLPEDILAGVETAHCHADCGDGRPRRWRSRSCLPAAWRWCRGWRAALAAVLGRPVRVAPQPQCTCAGRRLPRWLAAEPRRRPAARSTREWTVACTMVVQGVR